MAGQSGRARDWLAQAENDYDWAGDSFRQGHHAQTCFVCQQVAEKSLKAVAFLRGYEAVRGHSVAEIAKELGINDEILNAGRRLDQYYVTTRYPDALPSGAPFEFFTAEQAKEALGFAEGVLAYAKQMFTASA
jgi:HEPN domain-containing protein